MPSEITLPMKDGAPDIAAVLGFKRIQRVARILGTTVDAFALLSTEDFLAIESYMLHAI